LTWPHSSVLFDKGVLRRIYEGQARQAVLLSLTKEQQEATDAFVKLHQLAERLCITRGSHNILVRRKPQYAQLILQRTQFLHKARYQRHWARCLRSFSFTREDALVLAYGSFGVDLTTQLAGVEVIVTTDIGMVNNFKEQHAKIKLRFEQMIFNLPDPYPSLHLPIVLSVASALALT
jgi:hypothetical protein